MQGRWEHFEHPADMGIRGIGATLQEAFAQAALALTAVTVDQTRIDARDSISLTCTEPDVELLLVTWLNDILYEMSTRRMVFGRFDVMIEGSNLTATLWGEALDPAKHQPGTEVKAATYAQLKVEHQPNGTWIAQCIVDV